MKIKNINIRQILNSGGKPAIEVKLTLNNRIYGIASSPSAIIPGKREVNTTEYNNLKSSSLLNFINKIYKIRNITQQKLDEYLNENIKEMGSDITLAISLAFARAIANSKKISLIHYITNLTNITSHNNSPYPLVAIFSGGVHSNNTKDSLQQIMITINTNNFNEAIDIILNIYNTIEKNLKENNYFVELGSSSGFIVKNINTEEQLTILTKTINDLGYKNIVSIAIDVAAEHLRYNNNYKFEDKTYSPDEFYNLIQYLVKEYSISFVEDPFDLNDQNQWIKLKNNNKDIIIVGDDLFSTQSQYINPNTANGIVIKMNQVGTLSKTLETIYTAKQNNIKLCVSHRSLETDDTFMCDLAVAINSEFIKIGGPRRNDRIVKYNRLLDITKNTQL